MRGTSTIRVESKAVLVVVVVVVESLRFGDSPVNFWSVPAGKTLLNHGEHQYNHWNIPKCLSKSCQQFIVVNFSRQFLSFFWRQSRVTSLPTNCNTHSFPYLQQFSLRFHASKFDQHLLLYYRSRHRCHTHTLQRSTEFPGCIHSSRLTEACEFIPRANRAISTRNLRTKATPQSLCLTCFLDEFVCNKPDVLVGTVWTLLGIVTHSTLCCD